MNNRKKLSRDTGSHTRKIKVLRSENHKNLFQRLGSKKEAFVSIWCVLPKSQSRETREGWPLLTVETVASGDSWSTYEGIPNRVTQKRPPLCKAQKTGFSD
jgi:hypothetical protein